MDRAIEAPAGEADSRAPMLRFITALSQIARLWFSGGLERSRSHILSASAASAARAFADSRRAVWNIELQFTCKKFFHACS